MACFECLGDQEYADVALALKETALKAEECIFSVERVLRAAVNLPTVVTGIAPSVTPIPANIRTLIDFGTPTFQNTPFLNQALFAPARGVYLTGISFTALPTGAVTDNTHRVVDIATRPAFAPVGSPDDQIITYSTYEATTGTGMDMSVTTTVTLDGNQHVAFYFAHNNASTVNLNSGLAFLTRISDIDVTRVVA